MLFSRELLYNSKLLQCSEVLSEYATYEYVQKTKQANKKKKNQTILGFRKSELWNRGSLIGKD